jgi:hypothetical protein
MHRGSGVNWGDVPTWIAVFVAAIGGAVALIQLHRQGEVLKGEVERNKRRDKLLDGQLAELRDRELDRVREQAESVAVGLQLNTGEGPFGYVTNGSRRPITEVVAGIVEPLATGGNTTHHAGTWTPDGPSETGSYVPLKSAEYPVLRPKEVATAWFTPNQLPSQRPWRLVVRFKDDAGRRWQLDDFQHLERAPDGDGW